MKRFRPVVDRQRHYEAYMRVRPGSLRDSAGLEEFQELTTTVNLPRLVGFPKMNHGGYGQKRKTIEVNVPRFGSRQRRERQVNRSLIHETTHYADDRAGRLESSITRQLDVIGRLGTAAMALLTPAYFIAEAITDHDAVTVLGGASMASCVLTAVGAAAHCINPHERRARAAERVLYDAEAPIISLQPLSAAGSLPLPS